MNQTMLFKEQTTPKSGEEKPCPFAQFWKIYPRQVGRKQAERTWNRLKPNLQEVLEGLAIWKKSTQWTKSVKGEWIPYASTFLRREQWKERDIPEQQRVFQVKPEPKINQPAMTRILLRELKEKESRLSKLLLSGNGVRNAEEKKIAEEVLERTKTEIAELEKSKT